ncbi:MAG TPA: DUF4157 domain-containing protein [Polyangiaceae bacterium]|nr:DUF4157 domain-containing protein [Polyangiaceae bacterium]
MDKQAIPPTATNGVVRVRQPEPIASPELTGQANRARAFGSALGNRAFGTLLQAKLQVGPPNDAYEQEADRIADDVVQRSMAHTGGAIQPTPAPAITPWVQRQTTDEEDEPVQAKLRGEVVQREMGPEEDEPIQARQASSTGVAGRYGRESEASTLETRLAHGGTGEALSAPVRGSLEDHFGRDFGNVRIHRDGDSDNMARDVGALAFTHGTHIYFRSGEYAPETDAGRHLLAHELTHTLQQTPSMPPASQNSHGASSGASSALQPASPTVVQRACSCGTGSEECASCGG